MGTVAELDANLKVKSKPVLGGRTKLIKSADHTAYKDCLKNLSACETQVKRIQS